MYEMNYSDIQMVECLHGSVVSLGNSDTDRRMYRQTGQARRQDRQIA